VKPRKRQAHDTPLDRWLVEIRGAYLDLARRAGLSHTTVQRIAQGRRPSVRAAVAILGGLNDMLRERCLDWVELDRETLFPQGLDPKTSYFGKRQR
jgi:transcriptional regulator with XRE-family HTH domain